MTITTTNDDSPPTSYEMHLIYEAINQVARSTYVRAGDNPAAQGQARYWMTEAGIASLVAQGRHMEAMLARAFAASQPSGTGT